MDKINAYIMAAGSGTRLKKDFDTISKPLFKLNNKPLIEWVIESWKYIGVKDIIVARNINDYLLKKYIDNHKLIDLPIESSSTFETLFHICKNAQEKCIGLSPADTIVKKGSLIQLKNLLKKNLKYSIVTITEDIQDDSPTFAIVDKNDNIIRYDKKPHNISKKYTLGGYYFLCRKSVQFISSCKITDYRSATRAFNGIVRTGIRMASIKIKNVYDIDTANDVMNATRLYTAK